MTTEPDGQLSEPPSEAGTPVAPEGDRRQHPSAVLLEAAGSLRELLLPLGALIVFGASSGSVVNGLALAVVGLITALAMGIVRWATTTYRVTPDRVVLRSGVFSPDERLVPRTRISSVDVVQGPVQRMLGVVELHIQAAGGGGKAEIALRAISPEEASVLRAELGHARAPAPADGLWRLSSRGLLATALTGPQIGLLIPVAAGVGALLQEVNQLGGDDDLRDSLPSDPTQITVLLVVLALALLTLTVGGALLAFGAFEVRREGRLLRVRRGLLQRRAVTIPVARIHGLRLVENPLRQGLGLVAVHVETVAHGGQQAAEQTLLPLIRRRDLAAVLGDLLPSLVPPEGLLLSPPPRSRRRYALPPAALGLAVACAASIAVPAAWPLIPVLTLLGALAGLLRFADAGWALDGTRVAIRSRRLSRTTLIARAARVQLAELSTSVFQRRAGLATAGFAVGAGRRARIAHLEAADAGALLDRLRAAAEQR